MRSSTSLLRTRSALLACCALLLLPALLISCSSDDPVDPVVPASPYWAAVELPAGLPAGTLTAVSIAANNSAAVGAALDGSGFLLQNTSEGWVTNDVPALQTGAAWDVAFDGSGQGVIVGLTTGGQAMILAQRPDWTSVFTGPPPTASFVSVAVDDAGEFVATGAQTNEVAVWTGSAEGAWNEVPVTTPGAPNDKGLVDVAYGASTWAACGFDDGADGNLDQPYSILMLDQGSGYISVPTLCGDCGDHDFKSVAIDASGTIYLGGTQTNFGNDGEDPYIAFLWSFEPDIEQWTEIELPDPGSLDRVNEILLSSDGDIYLACGVDIASLVHIPSGAATDSQSNIEYIATDTRLYGLGQTSGGTVYATGMSGLAEPQPLMLQRNDPPT